MIDTVIAQQDQWGYFDIDPTEEIEKIKPQAHCHECGTELVYSDEGHATCPACDVEYEFE